MAVSKDKVDWQNKSLLRKKLQRQFERWQGTPYQYGGTSLSGIDCSALVQNTFASQLGYQLGRTTGIQIKQGVPVDKSQLQLGDIVFFKVASNTLHNGIYLGEYKFMHASSSRGVIVSDLRLAYWQKHYLHARRIR